MSLNKSVYHYKWLLESIKYPGLYFSVTRDESNGIDLKLYITGSPEKPEMKLTKYSRKLYDNMSDEKVIKEVYRLIIVYEVSHIGNKFKYKGEPVGLSYDLKEFLHG